jgi:hypothetical protein
MSFVHRTDIKVFKHDKQQAGDNQNLNGCLALLLRVLLAAGYRSVASVAKAEP